MIEKVIRVEAQEFYSQEADGSQELKRFCFSRSQQHWSCFGTTKETAVTAPGLKIIELELGKMLSIPCVLHSVGIVSSEKPSEVN